jgi:hypothetical protein
MRNAVNRRAVQDAMLATQACWRVPTHNQHAKGARPRCNASPKPIIWLAPQPSCLIVAESEIMAVTDVETAVDDDALRRAGACRRR